MNAREMIRQEIKRRGITQRQAAFNMGLSEQYLSQVLNGVTPISLNMARILQAAFGLDAQELLTRQVSEQLGRPYVTYTPLQQGDRVLCQCGDCCCYRCIEVGAIDDLFYHEDISDETAPAYVHDMPPDVMLVRKQVTEL